jgi:hypothetical protein
MFLNTLILAIWMLARGVDRDRWDRATASAPGKSGKGP